MDTIQINKFSHLHDGKNIIFCKTDFLLQEFEYIKTIPNEVILISGNSDYVIDDSIYKHKPDNVVKWYAQNAMFVNDVIECLPLGIENKLPSVREGHGIGWGHRVRAKEECIINHVDIKPSKFIYSNFQVNTNPTHRNHIKSLCESIVYIDCETPNLTVDGFMNKLLDYEAVICPIGNGPDTHRFYEVLYMNRIPIVFESTTYENLHNKYPSILISDFEQLYDYDFLYERIHEEKNKVWNREILYMSYWVKKIQHSLFF